MPEIPDHVPVYISSDFGDEPDQDSVVPARESLLQDRSAATWQPYLPPQGIAASSVAPDSSASPDILSAPVGPLARESSLFSRRSLLVVVALTALNLFAFGVWAGFYLIPREPVTTSLKPTTANLFGTTADKAPNLVADIASKANPAVVTIDIKFTENNTRTFANHLNMIPPAEASGLLVRSDGYILTNSHVIHRNSEISVTLNDKRVFPAKLIGRDDYSDLAVIKIDGTGLPVLKFADSKTVRPGDWAIAIGSPLGFDHTLTLGVISAINRSLSDFKNRVELIQHDAALNLGNSGGPLLNINGEVIGINTAVRSQAVCIGFATPSNVASEVATRLIADGQIPRAYLGVYMEDVDPDRTRSLTLPSHPVAVKITRLASGGPAEKAGVLAGDLITKINGIVVSSKREVRELTQASKPGDRVNVLVERGSRSIPLTVIIGDLSKDSPEF